MILTCPECSKGQLIDDIEEGVLIYSCENCGWGKSIEDFFYVTAWNIELKQALTPVDILHSVLTGSEKVNIVRKNINGISYLNDCKDFSDEYFDGEINIAHQIYLKQMIVLATSYLELMLKDFFRCQFISNPSRMNQYLSKDKNGKAQISLNDIIREPSKEALIKKLAEQAASQAIDPKFDKTIYKIISKGKIKIDKPTFIDDIRNLNELRNRIVHEVTKEQVEIDQVYSSFGLIIYLLFILEQAAIINKVPYFDEFGFYEEIMSQLSDNKE